MIGIVFNKRAAKWLARVGNEHIGSFVTEAEAIAAQAEHDPLGTRHIKRQNNRPFSTSHFSISASPCIFTMARFRRTRESR
jgi:hypothetical protein